MDVSLDPGPGAGLFHHLESATPGPSVVGLSATEPRESPLLPCGRGTRCATQGRPREGHCPPRFKGLRAKVWAVVSAGGPGATHQPQRGAANSGTPSPCPWKACLSSPSPPPVPTSSFPSYSFHTRHMEAGPCSPSSRLRALDWKILEPFIQYHAATHSTSPVSAVVPGTQNSEHRESQGQGSGSQTLRKGNTCGCVVPVCSSLWLSFLPV